MAGQQSLNATFFAFKKRENGGVLIGASVFYAIALIVSYAVVVGVAWLLLGGPSFMTWYNELAAAQARGETSSAMPPNMGGLLLFIPVMFIWVFLLFILFAAYESACVRWMIRGDKSAPLNLHFGADMWRTYGTYWFWLVYSIVSCIIFFVATFVVGLVASAAGDVGAWITLAAVPVLLVAWLYTTVRLSPASATSIGIGEFAPFKAWRVSSGRFWALFGSYLLLFVIYIIVLTIVSMVVLGSYYAQIFGGLDWTLAQTDPESFMRQYEQASLQAAQNLFATPLSTALYIGGQLLIYAVAIVFYVLWFGVQSRAVQAALEDGKIERAAAPS
ncbi:MAG: hypothetical protein NT015_18365 [Alphaproteobacteria bacterium]|nr:hypothetical protein [Alphaproteobacteria bacterium]